MCVLFHTYPVFVDEKVGSPQFKSPQREETRNVGLPWRLVQQHMLSDAMPPDKQPGKPRTSSCGDGCPSYVP